MTRYASGTKVSAEKSFVVDRIAVDVVKVHPDFAPHMKVWKRVVTGGAA